MIYDLELTSKVESFMVGKELLDYLYKRFDYRGIEFWREKVALGEVQVNGAAANVYYVLQGGDIVSYRIEDFYEEDLDCNYKIEYEDEHIVVVSKPANLPVQANKRFIRQTMTAILRNDLKMPNINPVHRLDRETSGLMIYLKERFTKAPYNKYPIKIMEKKLYLAVVRGELGQDRVRVDLPLREAKDGIINYRMIPYPESSGGKGASTVFYRVGNHEGLSLLLCELLTGKKHQIRAHASHLNLPIVGDKLYYKDGLYFLKRCNDELTKEHIAELGANCHLLHAYYLAFRPGIGLPAELYSHGYSEEMKNYLNNFKGWQEKVDELISQMKSSENRGKNE